VPAAGTLSSKQDGEWKPGNHPTAFGIEKDQPNVVRFDPVETTPILHGSRSAKSAADLLLDDRSKLGHLIQR
jgi:hypothetical protein